MHDIFISYSHQDHDWVARLAATLEKQGYGVWWDRELLASQDYAERIEIALNVSHCILTVWSPNSVKSKWVRAESGRGFNQDKLVPVLMADSDIPIPFDSVHTADLRGWEGDTDDNNFVELLKALEWKLNTKGHDVSGRESTAAAVTTSLVSAKKKSKVWVLGLGLLAGGVLGAYLLMEPEQISAPTAPKQGLFTPPVSTADAAALKACQEANRKESIIQAAGRGHIDRVQACINLGVDVNLSDANQWAPLHAAAHAGYLEIVKLLISHGSDIDAEANSQRTALYLAVMANKYAVVDYLKKNGASVKKSDSTGTLPFGRAKTDQMKKLLRE
uniref:TIR protein n=1 Tax=uncultured Thiotrichaceae bacterium TaxID=298394 RepID=A0A6S6S833_9GAMM|nr:MAG: TIR protein [uncultured Thiotrichaceae bacterium]